MSQKKSQEEILEKLANPTAALLYSERPFAEVLSSHFLFFRPPLFLSGRSTNIDSAAISFFFFLPPLEAEEGFVMGNGWEDGSAFLFPCVVPTRNRAGRSHYTALSLSVCTLYSQGPRSLQQRYVNVPSSPTYFDLFSFVRRIMNK